MAASSRVAAARKEITDGENIIASNNAKFTDIGVTDWLAETLKSMHIRKPTEIQRACIPAILAGRNVIGGAKTGSGKTAAFALPIIQKLSEDPFGVFAVVLTPTRELAIQIAEQFRALGKTMGLKECIVIGGLDIIKQASELQRRPHVIIATPGRLRHHIENAGVVHLSRARFLVMDEADRLLSPTFSPELEIILSHMPEKRQTLLFTATVTEPILALQDSSEKQPFVHICDMETSTVATLDQLYVLAPSHVRLVYLVHILRSDEFKDKSIIIFCGRCSTAELITVMLKDLGIRCTALHSEMSQRERLNSLGKFRAEAIKVLVSTDVGSRGLDIPSVELVLNYDIPRDPTDYIHRVGRTARAGRRGKTLSIMSESDIKLIENIEARINKKMEEYTVSDDSIVDILSEVTEAKRAASMYMHDSKFDERHNAKKKKLTHTT